MTYLYSKANMISISVDLTLFGGNMISISDDLSLLEG